MIFGPPAHRPTARPTSKDALRPKPGIIIDRQHQETRDHKSIPSVPGNETRKWKISANHAPVSPLSQCGPSSGSLELLRSGGPLQQIPSRITHADSSTDLSVIRSAIRASRWLQQQTIEPTIGPSGDTIPRVVVSADSQYICCCSMRITAALDRQTADPSYHSSLRP